MIPTAPGFVGVQLLCVTGLDIFGIGQEEALSFSILSLFFSADDENPGFFYGEKSFYLVICVSWGRE